MMRSNGLWLVWVVLSAIATPSISIAQSAASDLGKPAKFESAPGKRFQFQGMMSRFSERDPQIVREVGAIAVKKMGLPSIEFYQLNKIPTGTFELKVGVIVDPQGLVVDARVLDDSPMLKQYPELKDLVEALVRESLEIAQATLFEVRSEGNLREAGLLYRSVQLRVRLERR